MKKIYALLTALLFASSLFFVSCVDEEACEEDNTGTVMIVNNTGEYWVFDVTYKRDGSDWVTNEEIGLFDGGSYTWKDVGAGEVAIWASDFLNPWEIDKTITLGTCEDYVYNVTKECELFNFAHVTVTNSSGDWMYVTVEDEDGLENYSYIANGSSADFYPEYGQIRFAYKWSYGDSWSYSQNWYSVSECEDFDFKWTKKKASDAVSGDVATKDQAIKVTKKGSTFDFSALPEK